MENEITSQNSILENLKFGFKSKVPLILQTQAAECGLCCLAMVAAYFGNRTDIISLRSKFTISYHGLNLQQMITIADKLSLNSNAVKLDLNDVQNLQLPCILHWDLNHFVVLKKVNKNSFEINDPAKGERTISSNEFSKHFTGVAMELTPTNNFGKITNKSKLTINKLTGKLIGYKSRLTEVLFLSLVLQFIALAFPFYTQAVVDDVVLRNDTNLLIVLAIGFSILMLFRECVEAIRSFLILRLSTLINIQMGANIFRHLLKLPMNYFETREMGDVVSRFGSINKVKEMLTTGFITAFVDGFMAIMVLAMMFYYSSKLAAIVVGFIILHIIVRMISYRPLRVRTEESIGFHAKKDTNFMESVRAIQSIKIFEKESDRNNLWLNRYLAAANKDISIGKLNILFNSWQGVLFGAEGILIIYLAAFEVIDNKLTLGMLFAFLSYKDQLVQKATSLVNIAVDLKILKLHLARLSDIVFTKPEIDRELLTGHNQKLTGNLSLKNVSFRYSDVDKWVLKNINLEIKAGESVAIIGASGCGKTTLLKIMMGLLKPTSGEVLANGVSIANIENYRSQICGVMQHDQLVSGSIADNISFSDPQLDMSRITYSAKMAAIHETVMDMPMQYNTLIGDMGASVSGGQKQRIILARAIYKKPTILFLDEATSHLDIGNESIVNNHIKDLNITRVIIAHRKETIASAQRVINLEELNKEINQQEMLG